MQIIRYYYYYFFFFDFIIVIHLLFEKTNLLDYKKGKIDKF